MNKVKKHMIKVIELCKQFKDKENKNSKILTVKSMI